VSWLDFCERTELIYSAEQGTFHLLRWIIAKPGTDRQGAGFTREERSIFGLEGFLPYDVHSLEKQCLRAWNQLLKVRQIPCAIKEPWIDE
jgi:hypothetical protein